MSIVRDYSWYYADTHVGYRIDGVVHAFRVESIDYDGDEPEEDEFYDDDLDRISLYGYYRNEENWHDLQYRSIPLHDGNLVLKLPRLGQIKIEGTYRYLSYIPHRSVKKGFCEMRVAGNHNGLTSRVVAQIFKDGYSPSPKCPFNVTDGKIMYKFDTCIGDYTSDTNWAIIPSASYLIDRFKAVLNDPNNPAGLWT
jgi:hypothetical protein